MYVGVYYVCMSVCLYECMYARMLACISMCVCIYIYIYIYTYIYTYTYIPFTFIHSLASLSLFPSSRSFFAHLGMKLSEAKGSEVN